MELENRQSDRINRTTLDFVQYANMEIGFAEFGSSHEEDFSSVGIPYTPARQAFTTRITLLRGGKFHFATALGRVLPMELENRQSDRINRTTLDFVEYANMEVGFAELGSSHEEAISSVARPENSKAVGYKHKER